jgi:hypothetical protein
MVGGSAVAVNAAGDVALFATEEADDQAHVLRIHTRDEASTVATFDFDANLDPAAFVSAHAATLTAPLAGFALVRGVPIPRGARPAATIPNVGRIAYDAKAATPPRRRPGRHSCFPATVSS